MRENLKIKEQLRVVIVDSKTKKVIEDKIVYPRQGVGALIDKIKSLFGIHNSVTDYGKEQAAKLFGGLTGYPINMMTAARGGELDDKTDLTITYEDVGKLIVSNENDPWTTAGT